MIQRVVKPFVCVLTALLVSVAGTQRGFAQEDAAPVDGDPPAPSSAEGEQRPDAENSVSEPLASTEDQARLGMWIEYVASEARSNRLTSGASLLVGSAIGIGFGIPLYIQRNPRNELNKGIGISLIAFSGAMLAAGATQLATKSIPEKRLDHWKKVTKSPLTLRELARFEGELRTYGDIMRRNVLVSRWMNFGMGLTGILILGLTPAAHLSRDAATIGYVVGGVMAGLGFLGFGFSFRRDAAPDYWNAYLQGQRPPARTRWSVAPSTGYTYAGARVVCAF